MPRSFGDGHAKESREVLSRHECRRRFARTIDERELQAESDERTANLIALLGRAPEDRHLLPPVPRFWQVDVGRYRQRQVHPESRAAAGCAVDANVAAHQLYEVMRNGRAEAGASVSSRGRGVGLNEAIEKRFLLVERNADPRVDHFEANSACDAHDAQRNAARRRELEGVVQEIPEHMLEVRRVTVNCGGYRDVDVKRPCKSLRRGLRLDEQCRPAQKIHQVEQTRFRSLRAGLQLATSEEPRRQQTSTY